MWFKSKKQPPPDDSQALAVDSPQRGSPAALGDDVLDHILDTLASVVRLLGQHAFETSDSSSELFAEQCEQWCRHILVGAATPSALEKLDDDQPPPRVPLEARDWKGLYHFLHRQRLAEEQAIDTSVSLLRNLIIDSLSRFRQLIDEDHKLDEALDRQLQSLRFVVRNQPLETVQAHIQTTVQSISELLDEKHRSQDRQLEQMRLQIQAAREEILNMRREMEEDSLTGTHNRRALDKAIARFTDYATFVKEDLAVLIIDVDHLKAVNDVKGHQAGDAMLRAAGQTLIRAFPRKDDFVARYGGDEFCVILSRTDRNTAIRLAQRCNEFFRALEIPWQDDTILCTVSIGGASYHASESIESCLARADQALYKVKQAGRDDWAYADDLCAP